MKHILILVLLASSPSFALRGIYAGLRGGSVSLASGASSGTGIGLDVSFRVAKSYDLTASFQSSNSHPDGFTSRILGGGLDMRMFRGMADMELFIGVGAGAYSLSLGDQTDVKFGLNFGINLDFLMTRAFHLGTQVRYHNFSSGPYGSTMQTFMLRLGYYFGMNDTTLTLPDMQ